MNAAADYIEIHERFATLARSGIRDYDFYTQVRSEGVSSFFACCLLRDYFGKNLKECSAIKIAHEGYTNDEIKQLQNMPKPDRGVYCPKCDCHIPMFHSICPETELEIRAMDGPLQQMKRVIEITGCPQTWAKIWALHPDGPHRRFGDTNAPSCPHCGQQLRTLKAKQCVECGVDWH